MGAVTIRPAEQTDKQAIERTMEAALEDAGALLENPPSDGDPTWSRSDYVPPRGQLFVATRADEVVGTGGYRPPGGIVAAEHGPFSSEVAELKRMHVNPEHQRQGVGSALFERIVDAARDAGYETFVLTTTDRQSAAHTFYEDRGFELFDRHQLPKTGPPAVIRFYRGSIPQ